MRLTIKYLYGLLTLVSLAVSYEGLLSKACSEEAVDQPKSFYDLSAVSLEGKPLKLSQFKGKVTLVVNTASKCGFTGQYSDLQSLYTKYHERGFEILGFPSNDFRSQEPGSNEEIARFCKLKYGVTFPMLEKAPVKGEAKQPIYKYLTEESGEEFQGEIGWNFEKFLVDRQGKVRARFGSFTNPESGKLTRKLEELLQEAG